MAETNETIVRRFCDDPLWDLNSIWYTTNPDFTTCFQQTVLTYVPAVVLLLLTPFSVWSASNSKDRKIPWTILNIAKLVVNILLIIIPFVDLGYAIDK